MKRFIFLLMIFVLVFSVFSLNTMLVAAEGEEDTSSGTEETIPEGEGDGTEGGAEGDATENGGEELPPEGEGTEDGGEELPPEDEGTEETEDELTASQELFALVDELKEEIFGLVKDIWNFICSNETYKNIATAVVAVVAILLIPIIIALAVIAYIAMAVTIWVAGALMSLIEAIIAIAMGAVFIS